MSLFEAPTCHKSIACITDAGLGSRLLAGSTTGAMAVAFAQPTDVVKVRFQAQALRPESGSVKRYSSTTDAYRTIARDEGFKGLWKGILKYTPQGLGVIIAQHDIPNTTEQRSSCSSYDLYHYISHRLPQG